jgi:2,4-dienoyl-CoA reductase-like NADH-dependent reductase (Old Yellow Enzyme family)
MRRIVMSGRKSKITRREFLEISAGALGTVLIAGVGCYPPHGREDYHIFSEGQLGPLGLKNRLIRSATFESAGSNGEVTNVYIDLLRKIAEGGLAMITTGATVVVEENALPTQIHVYDDQYIEGLSRVADAVHTADSECKIIAQVCHRGNKVAVLSTEEVEEIITSFAEAIRRVQQAGWDGVELHGAHSYLLSSFLSPLTNIRTDKFGGSIENRVRIITDIMDQARELVGEDFLIQIKVNCYDIIPGGIDINNFPELAMKIEKTGIDAINISAMLAPRENIDSPEKQSYFLKYAEALDVDVPIILTGGNRSIELLEGILQNGKVDFFGLARPLVREPDLPDRWLQGSGEAESTCISCNGCLDKMRTNPDEPLFCTQYL